jgi:uroporphyrinogen III methyltransferase / synthase
VSAAQPGVVYLVGAGPGDPGLLTVRGRALLDDCDVVVHDALVMRELFANRSVDRPPPELHFVGKRGGDAGSADQKDINATLVRLALAGKSVVRLKGGDPFVFGRGGEEAQALTAAGVPFEVVPGITAGTAGPAYAGIPVTHRGLSTAVTFVTGHEDASKATAQTDWAALARGGGTIVLYMGVSRLPVIAEALISGGMPRDTPAAAIQWATTPSQRTVEGTVGTIAACTSAAGLSAPVLTVIGPVVSLRRSIRWFDHPEGRPLAGQRVLVTRAAAQASGLSAPLRALGAQVAEIPVVRIEPLDTGPLLLALRRLSGYQHIIFTSQTAVGMVWKALIELGHDARALAGLTVSAVGPTTAAALLEHGIVVDVIPRRFVAEELLEVLRLRGDIDGRRVLYPVAVGARGVLPDGLRQLGGRVDVVPIYESVVDAGGADEIKAAVASKSLDLVTLTSASAVRGYVEAVGGEIARRLPAASIGPITTDAARAAGVPVVVEAREANIAALVEAVVQHAAATMPDEPADRSAVGRAIGRAHAHEAVGRHPGP